MAQRCSHCGRTEKKHLGPDGKYQACIVFGRTSLTPQKLPKVSEIYEGGWENQGPYNIKDN
jgi:hypothetical protein